MASDTTLIIKRPASSPANKEGKKSKGDLEADVCQVCTKAATNDILECSWCEGIQHASCSNLSVEQCNAITNITSANIVFFCTPCLRVLPSALKQYDNQSLLLNHTESQLSTHEKSVLTALNKSHEETCHKILDLTAKFNNVSSLNSQLEKKVDQLLQTIAQGDQLPAEIVTSREAPSTTKESFTQLASAVLSEQQEKERRQLNIVLHNVAESSSDLPGVRKQDDIKNATSIIDKYLAVKCSITNAVRLGKKLQGSKPRLLKITLASMQEKKSILRSKIHLRKEENPQEIKKIFITPDLTPAEQKQNKKLREELANLNKEGRKYMIKNGAIVQRGTR